MNVCAQCYREGKQTSLGSKSGFHIEVASKRFDGQERAAQVSVGSLCRKHANEVIARLRGVTDPLEQLEMFAQEQR